MSVACSSSHSIYVISHSLIMIIYIPAEIGIESLLSFRRLYRLSISSGDSKSISFDDFFLTRPDRDTPVTSKSENV